MALKHVGRIKTNRARVIVAYRTVPNEPYNALVIPTGELPADEHDAVMKAVESAAGQQANEFYEVMQRTVLPDGRNMLVGFHQRGNLRKFPTDQVEMTPNTNTAILLSELNSVIAEQQGISIEDLSISSRDTAKQYTDNTVEPAVAETVQSDVLTDDQLAAQYRSQADALFKEAQALRKQAEELAPAKKRTTTKKKAESVET
jgi:hypothetical protein